MIMIIIIIITKVFPLPGLISFFQKLELSSICFILTAQQTILTDLLKNIYVQSAK